MVLIQIHKYCNLISVWKYNAVHVKKKHIYLNTFITTIYLINKLLNLFVFKHEIKYVIPIIYSACKG